MKRIITIIALTLAMAIGANAQDIVRKSERQIPDSRLVIVGRDTISDIIPERNFGRYDRGLFNYLFVPKGRWALGLTANYGEFNTEDVQLLSILQDVDFHGKIYSVKPSISRFIKNNQSLGLCFNYTHGEADLGNLTMDFDEDLNFSVHDVGYRTTSFALSLFYRNYVGLSESRRFAVFNEVELQLGSGSSNFKRYYDNVLYDTHTSTSKASLNFSPGVCVFIQEYAAFNVSFGVFGLHLSKEKQKTNGENDGSRFTSGANFRFNIFNINFGLLIVI